jgi:hypothetical protein
MGLTCGFVAVEAQASSLPATGVVSVLVSFGPAELGVRGSSVTFSVKA